MSSLNYDGLMLALRNAAFNPSMATFGIMLVDDTYIPDKANHRYRSDVTGEITGASGYSPGGKSVVMTPTLNTGLHQEQWAFSSVIWNSSSITARGAVIYNMRGGAASADELVSYVDFGLDVTSVNNTFTAALPSPLIFQN